MKKRALTPEEVKKASFLFMKGISLKVLAKYFKVNKPAIMKSIGMWKTESKTTSDGTKYRLVRGKVDILEKPNLEVKDKGYEIR